MLQYSNDVFSNDLHKSINLGSFRMKLFKIGTCPNCLSLVLHMFALNMLQYIKLVHKRRINNFSKRSN